MKKFIAAVLSMLLICLALAGCGKSSNAAQGSENPADSTANPADNSAEPQTARPGQAKNLSEAYAQGILA